MNLTDRKKISKYILIVAVWTLIFAAGLLLIELYIRGTQGYEFVSLSLVKKTNYDADAKRKEFNVKYYQKNRNSFKNWPADTVFFDPVQKIGTDSDRPAYLFKTNYKETDSQGNIVWSTNSWGFRGPEFTVVKPTNTVRIVCLGSSTTQGQQAYEETYPFFLQKKLENIYPSIHFEVINAGHAGLNSQDLLQILIHRVFPLKPDLIIYYEMGNGIDEREPLIVDFKKVFIRNLLDKYSASYRLFEDRYQLLLPPLDYTYDLSRPYPSLEKIMDNVDKIVKESKKQGTQFVLVSPVSGFHKDLWNDGVVSKDIYWMYKRWYPIKPEDIDQWYDNLGFHFREIAEQNNVLCFDIVKEFPKEKKYFAMNGILDPSHYSTEGNKLLAKLIAERIIKEIKF